MKKFLAIAVSLVFAATAQAQKDVTRFLGIPVDGFKSEMIERLKEKGFRSISYDREVLEGEFNGQDVKVYVVTNNNRVYRIMVADRNCIGEGEIRIRFNRLCSQFDNNPKYISFWGDQTISDDEDISYEMAVHDKRYEAVFYQKADSATIANAVKEALLSDYTEEQLADPTEEMQAKAEELKNSLERRPVPEKSVWFMIAQHLGKYYISMYYDNKYNQASGEDL